MSDFSFILFRTDTRAVCSVAFFAAFCAAPAILILMLWISIIQIRHRTANRNIGMANDASIVTLALVSGADALSLSGLGVYLFFLCIAAVLSFLKI